MRASDGFLFGLRLIDEDGAYMCNYDWWEGTGVWMTQNIPINQEIIGLYISKEGNKLDSTSYTI